MSELPKIVPGIPVPKRNQKGAKKRSVLYDLLPQMNVGDSVSFKEIFGCAYSMQTIKGTRAASRVRTIANLLGISVSIFKTEDGGRIWVKSTREKV